MRLFVAEAHGTVLVTDQHDKSMESEDICMPRDSHGVGESCQTMWLQDPGTNTRRARGCGRKGMHRRAIRKLFPLKETRSPRVAVEQGAAPGCLP